MPSWSRTSSVALTTRAIAARRFSRVMNIRRARRSVASVSPWSPIATIWLMPMFVPSAKRQSSSRRRSTSRGTISRVATDENSLVKSTSQSVSLRMSRSSMVPQRSRISAFSASRFCGSSSLPMGGTLIHGSPRRSRICTPAVPLVSALSSPLSAAVRRALRSSTNALGSVGWRSAA
jgi:hypothetical protein